MATTAKALAFRDELAAELKIRLSSLAQTKSFGSASEPQLLVGAAAGGSDGFFLQISPVATVQKDILGLNQTVFTPHVAQLCFEADFAGTTDNVADVVTWPTKLAIIGMLVSKGIKVEVYESASGTAPSSSTIAAGNLKATFEPHLQYPLMASM